VKKMLLALLLVFVMVAPVMADQTYLQGDYFILGPKTLEVGTYYIGDRHTINLGGQLSLFSYLYKGDKLLNLDIGTLTADGMKFPITSGLSANLFTLAKLCHLITTAPQDLNLGVGVGKDLGSSWKDSHFWTIYLNKSFSISSQ